VFPFLRPLRGTNKVLQKRWLFFPGKIPPKTRKILHAKSAKKKDNSSRVALIGNEETCRPIFL